MELTQDLTAGTIPAMPIELTREQRARIGLTIRGQFVRVASRNRVWVPKVRAPYINPSASIIDEVVIALALPKRGAVIRLNDELITKIMGILDSYCLVTIRRMGDTIINFVPTHNRVEELKVVKELISRCGCTAVNSTRQRTRYEGFPVF